MNSVYDGERIVLTGISYGLIENKKPALGGFQEASRMLYMVHSGGFEPPTARFVAEYSIQLSYECVAVGRILGIYP